MDINERKKVVLAMELLARCVNDESAIEGWLMCGVADGDIPYGSIDITDVDDYYVENENFADLMGCFMRTMKRAQEGGLYVDGVVSE